MPITAAPMDPGPLPDIMTARLLHQWRPLSNAKSKRYSSSSRTTFEAFRSPANRDRRDFFEKSLVITSPGKVRFSLRRPLDWNPLRQAFQDGIRPLAAVEDVGRRSRFMELGGTPLLRATSPRAWVCAERARPFSARMAWTLPQRSRGMPARTGHALVNPADVVLFPDCSSPFEPFSQGDDMLPVIAALGDGSKD